MARRIQLRRDTAANWSATNPTLAQGEIGIDLTNGKIKIGTGSTAWNSLAYFDDKVTDFSAVATDILPDADNTRDLGSPAKQWRHVYTAGGSIYLDNIKLTNVGGKFVATKVINPGEENETEDPEDSDATSDISANLGNIKIDGSTIGTKDNPDTGGWGDYAISIDPGGESAAGIYIPSVPSQAEGSALQIYNRGNSDSPLQLFGRGNVQIVTGQDVTEKIFTFEAGVLQSDEVTIRTNDGDLNIESDSDVFVRTSLGNEGENQWKFDTNGKLELPRGGELWEDALIGAVNQDLFLGTKFTPEVSAECAFTLGNTFGANIEFNDDITVVQAGWTVNVGGTDYTVTAINPEPPPNQYMILVDGATFVQGETYTFTNPAPQTRGWYIRQGTGTLASQEGGAILSSESFDNGEGQTYRDFSVEVATPDGLNEHRWTFTNDGHLTVPGNIIFPGSTARIYGNTDLVGLLANPEVAAGLEIAAGSTVNLLNEGNVVISSNWGLEGGTKNWTFKPDGELQLPSGGDIVDSNGNSVLGGGAPTIPNTKRGFINLVGDRPNENDDIAFESVVVRGQYAYALGADYYINNSNNRAKIYKFDLQTGAQVWVKQISAGRGATFAITIGSGTITIDAITQSGEGYQIGEEITFEGYQVGGSSPQNNFIIVVDTVNVTGGILTASVKPGYNAGVISYNSTVNSYQDDAQGDTVAISYDDFNEKLVIVQEYGSGRGNANDSFWNWANIYVMDPVTGVINQTVTLTEEGDIYPNSIATHDAAGGVAIVGEKYNEYREFGPLTISAGYNGYFDILKSNLDPEHYPGAPYNSYGDFWITGTGIANQENVDQVNEYVNVATTVRQGSGAQVTIGENGAGSYTLIGIAAGGTNYLPGHIIRVLGTDLGGTTPENDALLQIITVGSNGEVQSAGISGSAFATAPVGGWTVSTVNYNVGSGYTAYIYINPTTGAFTYGGSNNGGSNYVAGDVITVPGTTFAGGTSPANDATLVVNTVDGSGSVQSITNGTASGTGPTGTIRIKVDGVDFTTGTYSMRQNLGGEAFIWTPNWSNAIGSPSGDKFYDVCWKADGTALYAVGTGVYETNYLQALVVKFNAADGAVVWSKDIKFSEAISQDREARAVAVIPGSTDIMVAGAWYNNSIGYPEIILTRLTDAGAAVWQKTYALGSNFYETNYYLDYEINLKATDNGMIVSFEQGTNNGNGLGWLQIDPTNGTVIRHRVLSADGNSNYNYYNTPTANFADIYTDGDGDHIVMAGFTYVPTDSYYNGLLFKLPVTGVKNIEPSEKLSLGEHILTRHDIFVTTVTPAFDSFTPDEHIDTITNLVDQRNYRTRAPDGELHVWTYAVTDDAAGYLEFGDGSRQSFATNVIPQIPAANNYYLTEQDSGKHIFFEHENGWVYIPHWQNKQLPVGFTFTIVNTTGSNCYVECQSGGSNRGRLKLAGRNIDTYTIGIPDSGSGSMVTFLKVKEGYTMDNSDGLGDYSDVWMVSGPGDIYDND